MRYLLWLSLALLSWQCVSSDSTQSAMTTPDQPARYWMFLASGSSDDGEGIGLYQWSPDTAGLVPVGNFALVPSSSYLAVAGDRLYSIQEDGPAGVVTGFQVNASTGALTKLGEAPTGGVGPCYVALADSGRKLLVAHYQSAELTVIDIAADGAPGDLLHSVQHEGRSVNPDRQQAAHPHMIAPVPGTDLVLVTDLGMDQVRAYRLGPEGQLSVPDQPVLTASPGAGPRHFAIHPSLPVGYWINELHNTVNAFRYDPEQGITEVLDTVALFGEVPEGANYASDLNISADGRFLYAAIRGADVLVTLAVDPTDGRLQRQEVTPVGGEWPRAFAIDPSGDYLLVAHQFSDSLTVFRRDGNDGSLSPLHTIATEASPQGIRFVPLAD